MKPQELKQEYVRLRAESRSYDFIAKELGIAKSTCTAWAKELEADIATLQREELNALYRSYGMTKKARIRRLGDTLGRIDDALAEVDLYAVAPEKLLDYKLKYHELLQKEYTGEVAPIRTGEKLEANDIVAALADLLVRIRAGEVTTDQVSKESAVLVNLLKAYETTEVKAKLEELQAIVARRE